MLVYICQDGTGPSGVATYGYHVLKNIPQARMLLLNANKFPEAAPVEIHDRLVLVAEDRSHSPVFVAEEIAKMVSTADEGVVILPNTGDTPWAATTEFLKGADKQTLSRIRILGIIHSDMESQYTLAETYLPIAPLWIGVSKHCAKEARRRISPRGGHVHEHYCPVEIPKKVLPRLDDDTLKIAYVGRLEEPQKRVSRLAEVFSQLANQGVKFSATVAGDGPAAAEFKKAIHASKIEKFVHAPGSMTRQAIDKIWQTHDIFILTSSYEGLPLGLLEAMAFNLCPVVMAVDSGLSELLEDKRNARVVAQGDVRQMVEVLKELAVDREQTKKLATAARQDIQKSFSPQRHFEVFQKIIKEVEASSTPRPQDVPPDETALAVESLCQQLARAGRPIVVYGSGMFGRKIVDRCLSLRLKVEGMIDSNPAKKGMRYREVECFTGGEISKFKDSAFAIGSLQFIEPISKTILDAFKDFPKNPPAIFSANARVLTNLTK